MIDIQCPCHCPTSYSMSLLAFVPVLLLVLTPSHSPVSALGSIPGHFVEALRQLQLLVKKENFCLIHVSMVPIMGDSEEQKTKPTQHR